MEEKRGAGRPKGHRLSDDTKAKIRKGVRAARKRQKEVAATNPGIPLESRQAVIERDEGRCRGCHDTDDLKVFAFREEDDLSDLDNLAYLCPFCRRSSRDLGKKTAREVP